MFTPYSMIRSNKFSFEVKMFLRDDNLCFLYTFYNLNWQGLFDSQQQFLCFLRFLQILFSLFYFVLETDRQTEREREKDRQRQKETESKRETEIKRDNIILYSLFFANFF